MCREKSLNILGAEEMMFGERMRIFDGLHIARHIRRKFLRQVRVVLNQNLKNGFDGPRFAPRGRCLRRWSKVCCSVFGIGNWDRSSL